MQWLIHVKTPAQTCFQNTELTLEMFRKISTSSCHQIPNELSNLLALVATCSTQTVNQNTNVPAEVCKVPIKRTCGLTVILLIRASGRSRKKSQISRDFQGQIRGKNSQFRGNFAGILEASSG